MAYEERTYRGWVQADDFVRCHVCEDESDLFILARMDVSEAALALLLEVRDDLIRYIRRDRRFLVTLEPHQVLFDAPLVASRMAAAAARQGVGPMAAVAGAIAECVGEQLARRYGDVVVENGGDVYARCGRPLVFSVYAGLRSPFTGRLRFRLHSHGKPLGVCTSSGTVGHSFSMGRADAVCVICEGAADADAAATAMCNRIKTKEDIDRVLELAAADGRIRGVLAAMEDRLGIWGDVEIVR